MPGCHLHISSSTWGTAVRSTCTVFRLHNHKATFTKHRAGHFSSAPYCLPKAAAQCANTYLQAAAAQRCSVLVLLIFPSGEGQRDPPCARSSSSVTLKKKK